MISDAERREVARRLRDDAKGGALPYSDFFGAVAYDVGVEKEHAAVLNRLADLIEPEPEHTCHDTDYSRESITCSECGEITVNTLYLVDLDGGYRTIKSHRPRFCSNCGARVEDE